MFRQILVPLDGSPLAEAVLPYVTRFSQAYEAQVTLATVIDAETMEVSQRHQQYLSQLSERTELHAREYLSGVGNRLRSKGLRAEETVLFGRPAESLVAHADTAGSDLIAMSTHGRSGLGRWISGSVADRVLHLSTVPLLVIRASDQGVPDEVKLTTLVAPLDGSQLAESVLPYVKDLARALALEVMLLQAVQITASAYPGLDLADYPQALTEELEGAAASYLNGHAEQLTREGIRCQARVLWGSPASAIANFAQALPDNLVAMSTHGRSGFGRAVLGSVADRVIRGSGDAVLVVRPGQG